MATNEILKTCIRNALALEKAHVGNGRLDTARAAVLVRAQAGIMREMFGATWTLEEELAAAQECRESAAMLNDALAGVR